MTKITKGSTSHQTEIVIANDTIGRPKSVTVDLGTTGASPVTEYYRDRFDNVAVIRRKNINENGAAPAPGARAWIRNEWHYLYGRLLTSYMDRAPLAQGPGNEQSPTTSGLSAWMAEYAFAYRTDGQIETVTFPNGSVNRYEIDGYGTLYRTVADTGGASVELGRNYFDNDLMLSRRERTLNSSDTATWDYDRTTNNGPIYRVKDPTGLYTAATYDLLGRVTTLSRYRNSSGSPLLQRTRTEYDEIGRRLLVHNDLMSGGSGTSTTDYDYDVWSNVVKVAESVTGRSLTRVYDEYGRLKTVRDGLSATPGQSNEVHVGYMPGRDLVKTTTRKIFEGSSQKSYVTNLEIDLVGRVVKRSITGLNGAQSALEHVYRYDGLGQLVFYQNPDQVGPGASPPNRYTRTDYDADGRWVAVTKYDSVAPNIELFSEYLDNPGTSATSPTITRKDGRGSATKWIYDGAYRLTQLHRPGYSSGSAHKTTIHYDEGSRPYHLIDGNGSNIYQTWDLVTRKFVRTAIVDPNVVSIWATEETIEFDELNRIKRAQTEAGTNLDLFVGAVDLTFDGFGRKTEESFTYGLYHSAPPTISNPIKIQSGYSTGGAGVGDVGFRRSLTYLNKPATQGQPSQKFEIGSTPDAIGRLTSRTLKVDSGAQLNLATYAWSGGVANGRTTSLAGSGSMGRSIALDVYRRLENLSHTFTAGTASVNDVRKFGWTPGGDLLKRDYTRVDGSEGDLFRYDAFHRLDGAKLGVSDITDSYGTATANREVNYALENDQSRDSVDEVTSGALTNYTNEASSPRYSQVGGVQPDYDDEGNLIFDGAFVYKYDFKNRLSEVYRLIPSSQNTAMAMKDYGGVNATRTSLTKAVCEICDRFGGDLQKAVQAPTKRRRSATIRGGIPKGPTKTGRVSRSSSATAEFQVELVAVYGYDPFNRRIMRVLSTTENFRYAYDGWREVEELVAPSSGADLIPYKANVWGAGFSELLSYHRREPVGNTLVWKGYLIAQDEQGSVTRVLRDDGTEIERYEYDPYGRRTIYIPTGSSTPPFYTSHTDSGIGLEVSYTGHRVDPETGLLYARHRYIHTEWGRFLSLDPLGSWADGASLGNGYAMAGNSPAVLVDRMGLMSVYTGAGEGGGATVGPAPSGGGAGMGRCGTPGIGGHAGPGSTSSPGRGSNPLIGALLALCDRNLCHWIGRQINLIARNSEDYSDFRDRAGDFYKIGEQIEAIFKLFEEKTGLGYEDGFKDFLEANGADNSKHYMAPMHHNWYIAQGGIIKDAAEFMIAKHKNDDYGASVRAAETWGSMLGVSASAGLHKALLKEVDGFFGMMFSDYDNELWGKIRHLPGKMWRSLFCD